MSGVFNRSKPGYQYYTGKTHTSSINNHVNILFNLVCYYYTNTIKYNIPYDSVIETNSAILFSKITNTVLWSGSVFRDIPKCHTNI